MSAEEQKIRGIIGQLEASIDEAEKHMSEEQFDGYTTDVYHSIGRWRVVLRKIKEKEE